MEHNNNTDTGDTTVAVSKAPALPPSIHTVREPYITTAVSFLQNPNVARSSIVQKQKFLRSKGLTENEIQIACERAGVFTNDPNASTVISMGITHSPHLVQQTGMLTLYQRVRDMLSSTALVAGIMYAIYIVYKRFIEPLLFGRKKKKRTIEEAIDSVEQKLERNMVELNTEIVRVRDEFRNTFHQDQLLQRDMLSFKNDLESIKGLLLNRKQFSSPIVPTSIPVWQLQSQRNAAVGDGDVDKHDDDGSADGSGGSSETEVVTKNSDSSLELIS